MLSVSLNVKFVALPPNLSKLSLFPVISRHNYSRNVKVPVSKFQILVEEENSFRQCLDIDFAY